MTTTTAPDTGPDHHLVDPRPAPAPTPRNRRQQLFRLGLGWGVAGLLVAHATFRGGIAFDLMFAVMHVVGFFTTDEVIPAHPDWWGMAHRSVAAVLAAGVAITTLRYQRRVRGACARCGRRRHHAVRSQPGRLLRAAAYAAAVPAIGYASLKVHWGLGGTAGLRDPEIFAGVRLWSPGFGDTVVMAAIGVVGTFAMAYQWHRIPRWLLLPPAVIGCALLLPVGISNSGYLLATAISGADVAGSGSLDPWVTFGIYPAMLLWGVSLAIVTVGYYYRTRGRCSRCGVR